MLMLLNCKRFDWQKIFLVGKQEKYIFKFITNELNSGFHLIGRKR